MTKRNGLPKRVYAKNGSFHYVTPSNEWKKLSRIDEGLPTMLRALAALLNSGVTGELMPALITRWLDAKVSAGDWGESNREDIERVTRLIAEEFRAIHPAQVSTPLAARFLSRFLKKPRTYNLYRSVLKQLLSFAALEGLREGHNPIDDIPQRKVKKRIRIVTPTEIDVMAETFMKAKRGGPAHVRTLGLLLKTGQRVSDVLKFSAQHCTDEGLEVDQGKTGAPLLIEWDDELRALVDACYEGRDRVGAMIVQSTGKRYTYSGVRSAWVRAMERAGIEDLHIHDLRGEAGARLADMLGPYAAQLLLGHTSIAMTEGYIKQKTRRRAKPAPLRKVVNNDGAS
jgi:integrase